jgi:hypothetical protein
VHSHARNANGRKRDSHDSKYTVSYRFKRKSIFIKRSLSYNDAKVKRLEGTT